jgi:hypothetical protein
MAFPPLKQRQATILPFPEEIDVLISTADQDGNGKIDYSEFCDRFSIAAVNDESQGNNEVISRKSMSSR